MNYTPILGKLRIILNDTTINDSTNKMIRHKPSKVSTKTENLPRKYSREKTVIILTFLKFSKFAGQTARKSKPYNLIALETRIQCIIVNESRSESRHGKKSEFHPFISTWTDTKSSPSPQKNDSSKEVTRKSSRIPKKQAEDISMTKEEIERIIGTPGMSDSQIAQNYEDARNEIEAFEVDVNKTIDSAAEELERTHLEGFAQSTFNGEIHSTEPNHMENSIGAVAAADCTMSEYADNLDQSSIYVQESKKHRGSVEDSENSNKVTSIYFSSFLNTYPNKYPSQPKVLYSQMRVQLDNPNKRPAGMLESNLDLPLPPPLPQRQREKPPTPSNTWNIDPSVYRSSAPISSDETEQDNLILSNQEKDMMTGLMKFLADRGIHCKFTNRQQPLSSNFVRYPSNVTGVTPKGSSDTQAPPANDQSMVEIQQNVQNNEIEEGTVESDSEQSESDEEDINAILEAIDEKNLINDDSRKLTIHKILDHRSLVVTFEDYPTHFFTQEHFAVVSTKIRDTNANQFIKDPNPDNPLNKVVEIIHHYGAAIVICPTVIVMNRLMKLNNAVALRRTVDGKPFKVMRFTRALFKNMVSFSSDDVLNLRRGIGHLATSFNDKFKPQEWTYMGGRRSAKNQDRSIYEYRIGDQDILFAQTLLGVGLNFATNRNSYTMRLASRRFSEDNFRLNPSHKVIEAYVEQLDVSYAPELGICSLEDRKAIDADEQRMWNQRRDRGQRSNNQFKRQRR